MIGQNKNLWDPKVKYSAAFSDVAGLKPGAPVRMGGVDIGAEVHFAREDDDSRCGGCARGGAVIGEVDAIRHNNQIKTGREAGQS